MKLTTFLSQSSTRFGVREVRDGLNHRFPLVASRLAGGSPWGIPLLVTLDYAISRSKRIKASSLRKELEIIAIVHDWCASNQIDFLARIQAGTFLTHAEVDQLAEVLRTRRMRSNAHKVPMLGPTVEPGTYRARLKSACRYVVWNGRRHQSTLRRGTPSSPNSYYLIYAEALKAFERSFKDHFPGVRRRRRKGLSREQVGKVLIAITPRSPSNPWNPSVQHRNFLIVALMLLLGLRTSEVRGLELKHVGTDPLHPSLEIAANYNNPLDRRARPASTKTQASFRWIPLTPEIYRLISNYVRAIRKQKVIRSREPFLFLSERGREISESSIYHLVVSLRAFVGHPTMSPHTLRHTFSDLVRISGHHDGLNSKHVDDVLRRLLGHSENSRSTEGYGGIWIEGEVNRIVFELGERLFEAYPQ